MKDEFTGVPDPARLFAFEPDPDRAAFLDARMLGELRASLTHLVEGSGDAGLAADLAGPIARLAEGERLPPVAFGQYFQTAEAALMGDAETARVAAAEIAGFAARGPRVIRRKGGDEAKALCAALDLRMGEAFHDYADVDEDTAQAFADRFAAGLDLIARHAPALMGELDNILHEILLVTEQPGAKEEFHGASHYQFWGLLMINPRHHPTRMAMAEVISHESAHSFLFGLTIEEPLVLNPDDDLFSSPLRADPRPMDGIYHASFVSARMFRLMNMLADADSLSQAERDEARVAADRDRDNFWKGYGVIAEHGRLSPTGQAIMDNAHAFMETNAPRP